MRNTLRRRAVSAFAAAAVALSTLLVSGGTASAETQAPQSTTATASAPLDQLVYRPPGKSSIPGLAQHTEAYCGGTGTDGLRYQLVYVYPMGTASNYSTMAPKLQNAAASANDIVNVSAHKTGGGRKIRYVTDENCVPTVLEVAVPADKLTSAPGPTYQYLLDNAGLNVPNRYYAVGVDTPTIAATCGIGTGRVDTTAHNNSFDGNRQWLRLFNNCMDGGPLAHEIAHNLGAVGPEAPNANSDGHCTDGWDLVCGVVPASLTCSSILDRWLFDCGNDDYFNTNPPAGSYLANYWNTADHSILEQVPPLAGTDLPVESEPSIWVERTEMETGDEVTLTALPDLPGYAYRWTFGNQGGTYANFANLCVQGSRSTNVLVLKCPSNAPLYNSTAPLRIHMGMTQPGFLSKTASVDMVVTKAAAPTVTASINGSLMSTTGEVPMRPAVTYQVTAENITGKAPITFRWTGPEACNFGDVAATTTTVTCTENTYSGASIDAIVFQGDGQWVTNRYKIKTLPAVSGSIAGATTITDGRDLPLSIQLSDNSSTVTWESSRGWPVTTTSAGAKVSIPIGTSGPDTITATIAAADGTTVTATHSYIVTTVALTFTATAPTSSRVGKTFTATGTTNKAVTVSWTATNDCTITPATYGTTHKPAVTCPTRGVGKVYATGVTEGETNIVAEGLTTLTEGLNLTATAQGGTFNGGQYALITATTNDTATRYKWTTATSGCRIENPDRAQTRITCAQADKETRASATVTATESGTVEKKTVQVTFAGRAATSIALSVKRGATSTVAVTMNNAKATGTVTLYTGTTAKPTRVAGANLRNGKATFTVKAPKAASYWVTYSGGALFRTSKSGAFSLPAATKTTIAYAKNAKRYTATLKTVGGSPVAKVALKLQRKSGSKWTTAQTVKTNAKGVATTTVKKYGKQYTYRWVWSGTSANLASTSPTRVAN